MSLCFFPRTAHAADASPEAEKGVGRHAPSFRGSCGFSEEKARMGRDVPVHPVPCPGRIFRHGREREGERPPCNGCAGECSCRKAESALSPEAAKAARPSARRSSKVPGTGTENVMSLRFGNNEFHERFDWYAWSASVYEGADAVLEALYARDFRKKRLKGVRVVGAARNMTREAFREYEKRSGHDRGPDGAARESDFRRFLNIPHSVMLCEPFILDFDDGTALEFHPGEGLSARMGWNLIPPSCTEGLNRPNFRPELLFTPYLAGRSLQRIFLREESSAVRQYVCSGGRVESSQKEGSVVRYVFCFSPDETLTATSDGSGWYELAFGTGGATASLPYRHFYPHPSMWRSAPALPRMVRGR